MADSPITTHVLDTARGTPAVGLRVVLERKTDAGYAEVGRGTTDADGRIGDLLTPDKFRPGVYLLHFDTGQYFESTKRETFYPEAAVLFRVKEGDQHLHVPLLVSPFGYSTYRGS
ncbi:MAG: hydroxyisourate hydrolase [Planctomycetota bacterium]